jgi:fused signal recognition particle receptor
MSSPEHSRQENAASRRGLFARLGDRLAKTRARLGEGLADIFAGRKSIDQELFDELETRLLAADVGVDATAQILDHLRAAVARKELDDGVALARALKRELTGILAPCAQPLTIAKSGKRPFVILVVGINGSGKTTSIGKLAWQLRSEGLSVLLAAGDTFRAAAVEQLKAWGARNDVPVIAQEPGADAAAVAHDAMQAAKARDVDVLIVDTAGRLHTQSGLMDELSKIQRVIGRFDPGAPHEVLLILDAGIGQNALRQVQEFSNAVKVTGLAITKLDGTAKGGVLFAIARQTSLPIRFIGVGEDIDDLRPFDADGFVSAIVSESTT